MHALGPTAGLIPYQDLLHLIAEALHPDPPALAGLPGVLGKRLFHPEAGVHTARESISAEEQDVLRALLQAHQSRLPPLRPVMNGEELAAFLRAYRDLPDRPPWEPALYTEHDVAALRSLRQSARQIHDTALKVAIAQGRMRHFDVDRMAVMPHFQLITYVPHEDVQSYLRPMALDLQAMVRGSDPVSVATPGISTTHPNTASVSPGATSPGLVPQGQSQPRRQWSAEDRHQILESERSGQLALVAQRLGISAQYARQLASRFEKEDAARRDTTRATEAAISTEPSPKTPTKVDSAKQEAAPASGVRSIQTPTLQPTLGKVMLRMPEVERRVGLKRSSIYARLDPHSKYYDPTFPQPVSLWGKPKGAERSKSNGGAVRFIQDEVDAWIESRAQR